MFSGCSLDQRAARELGVITPLITSSKQTKVLYNICVGFLCLFMREVGLLFSLLVMPLSGPGIKVILAS